MKNLLIFFETETEIKTETKIKAMKKMSLAFVLYSTFTLLSFTACSPGYGCFYSASETVSDQSKTSIACVAVDDANVRSEELDCLP